MISRPRASCSTKRGARRLPRRGAAFARGVVEFACGLKKSNKPPDCSWRLTMALPRWGPSALFQRRVSVVEAIVDAGLEGIEGQVRTKTISVERATARDGRDGAGDAIVGRAEIGVEPLALDAPVRGQSHLKASARRPTDMHLVRRARRADADNARVRVINAVVHVGVAIGETARHIGHEVAHGIAETAADCAEIIELVAEMLDGAVTVGRVWGKGALALE